MSGAAAEKLKASDLSGALEALQASIRQNPADAKLRIFLFQLLTVLGDWKRAVTQLKLSAEMEPEAVPMAQTYREGIICEVFREKVFAGEKEPLIFGEPQDWVALMIEALKVQAQGRVEDAAGLRARAFEEAPTNGGEINGARFDWIADADMRLGPLLEIVINGKYYWMPFTALKTVAIEPPTDLRDAVWTPATLTLQNGGEFVALIPSRYAGTLERGSDAAKLARETAWVDAGAETWTGLGQRLFATDSGDVALMEVRTLEFDAIEGAADTPAEAIGDTGADDASADAGNG
ncbi:MAG: type VI secretion system accessory protein TagJ [Pseudomonadota bacterium]